MIAAWAAPIAAACALIAACAGCAAKGAEARPSAPSARLIGAAFEAADSVGAGSAYAGLRKLAEERGGRLIGGDLEGSFGGELEIRCVWSRLGGEDYEQIARFLAKEGSELVICAGPGYAAAVSRVAADYPKTFFVVLDAAPDPEGEAGRSAPPNVTRISFSARERGYLAGTLAALAAAKAGGRGRSGGPAGGPGGGPARTARLGFAAVADAPDSRAALAGFRAGAASANRSLRGAASVATAYYGRPGQGFPEAAAERAAAASLYAKGATIVFHAGVTSGRGVFEAALAYGALAIGSDRDRGASYGSSSSPADRELGERILGSAVKRMDVAARLAAREFLTAGVLAGGSRELGVAQGCVDLVGEEGALAPYASALDAARADLASGRIKVPADEAAAAEFIRSLE
jgi:basic membrane protein A and related proteins